MLSNHQTNHLNAIIEALIFASDEPISYEMIKSNMEDATIGQIKKVVDALNLEYAQSNRSFYIVELAGGLQMVTREAFAPWIKRLFQKKLKGRLSQAALESLSVIAFKQPVSKTEVDAIRGVNSDGVMKTLLERKLIAISGRDDGPGRPLLYKTTKEFLRYFGINDIKDLPKPREIEELLKADSFENDAESDKNAVNDKHEKNEKDISAENTGNTKTADTEKNNSAVE